jgi:uncharacterized protein YyaL (SSP411 family)
MKKCGTALILGSILLLGLAPLFYPLWSHHPYSSMLSQPVPDLPNIQTMARLHNRLLYEKSPYLLQHAYNPVDWYPWGPEAFERAKREDKPVFLSIGYSTCHWCHVMAHESFEDWEVARLMNQTFVSIKVDREERPDIDNIYMTVCQMITGGGGWPLNIIMIPDKKPFFAGTYIPKESRFGQIGMLKLIPQIEEVWKNQRSGVLNSANQIAATLRQKPGETEGSELGERVLGTAYEQLAGRFDRDEGGFGTAPKFSTPHNLLFLLRFWKRTREPKALAMVEKTLQTMRDGGIYDQIGFGFHRYSTDARWRVPHFEKMLYDQALLSMAYTEAYQATGREGYRRTAEEILTYVLRDMTSPEGGFYSAEDADAEGEEGKYYVWTEEEIQQALPGKETELALQTYGIEKGGNFTEQTTRKRTGANILYLPKPLAETAREVGVPEKDLDRRMEEIRQKLFATREKRVHPQKDDKILTDWNGLAIAALAKAGGALGEPRDVDAAERAVDFILKDLRTSDKRLLHRYRDGEAGISASLDDYAFFIWGLIELYEATFKPRYLQAALDLNRELIQRFWDDQVGGFFFTPDDGEELLVRQKELYDGALPSGNSVALWNMHRLAHLTGDVDLDERAAQMERAFSGQVIASPAACTQFLLAGEFARDPPSEVVISGDPGAGDTRAMIQALQKSYLPNAILLFHPSDAAALEIERLAPFTKGQNSIHGKATAYVCQNHACHLPTTDLGKALELLNKPRT